MADEDDVKWGTRPTPAGGDALPTKLPTSAPLTRTPLKASIDYTINARLQDLIPKEANSAVVSVRLKGEGGDRILTGVVATRIGTDWGVDLGAALAGSLDLNDRRNYQIEFLGVVSWK